LGLENRREPVVAPSQEIVGGAVECGLRSSTFSVNKDQLLISRPGVCFDTRLGGARYTRPVKG
jgi:hypothetical protein